MTVPCDLKYRDNYNMFLDPDESWWPEREKGRLRQMFEADIYVGTEEWNFKRLLMRVEMASERDLIEGLWRRIKRLEARCENLERRLVWPYEWSTDTDWATYGPEWVAKDRPDDPWNRT